MSIKIENVEVVGWKHAIRGMRNPKNSWNKIDSYECQSTGGCHCVEEKYDDNGFCHGVTVGPGDHRLMMSLAKGGPVHAKYRRMITVYLDITAPFYWWKEFDVYRIGVEKNSCSTMHKITTKEITLDDFSFDEDLMDEEILFDPEAEEGDDFINHTHFDIRVDIMVETCERLRKMYNHYMRRAADPNVTEAERKHFSAAAKKAWRMLIQYLPTSYNQKRTVMLNYEVLANMYESRKNHKLTEWHAFCDWIESLPYSELIIGEKENQQ